MGICNSKNKISSPIHRILKGSPSNPSKTFANKCKIQTVNKEELVLLQLIYSDLCRKCGQDSITKDSFPIVFSLPV